MKTNHKKGFSLLEMSIVLLLIALVMSVFISFGSAIFNKTKLESTKYELQNIKNALFSYVAIHKRFPKADSDGDGIGDTIGFGTLPYLELGIQASDKYGITYQYDLSDQLASSSADTLCRELANIHLEQMDINSSTIYPQVVDESNNSKYVVSAIVISAGVDKVLSGNNAIANRKYEMAANRYDANIRDDLVLELGSLELLSKVCNLNEADISSEITIEVTDDKDIRYVKSDDPSECIKIKKKKQFIVYEDQNITFYHKDDNNCDGNSLFKTYTQLRAIDIDPKDYFIYVDHTAGGGQPAPTLLDN